MRPKTAKKKGAKQQEKKVANVLAAPQIEEDSEFDELEGLERGLERLWDPVEQLELPDEELNKDVTLILRAENPYFSEEFVEFSFKDSEYKTLSNFPDTVTFYSQTGTLVQEFQESLEEESEEGQPADGASGDENLDTKRKNKFNFCDRAVQTMNMALREECLQTEPPAQSVFSENATLWDITTAYEADHKAKESEGIQQIATEVKLTQVFRGERVADDLSELGHAMKVLERMVNQNKFLDVVLDYNYYDNPCDEFLEQGMGSVLPLWKFSFRNMKGTNVRAISWNHFYSDMFVAAFGSNDFSHGEKGCICIYTLKCPLYPERVYSSDVAVQCVDLHQDYPYLLAAGLRDGSVAVYDLRSNEDKHIATSRLCRKGHNDTVSQVKWLKDNVEEQQNFCSVSADGRVLNWTLAKSELLPTEVITLTNEECVTEGLEGAVTKAVSGGTSVSFNSGCTDLFLVGTEEGLIQKYSSIYSNYHLCTYKDHSNIVYNVEWNPYHPRVFLTCSADWTIRIWDHLLLESVFIFDMFNEVMTASWAPFSSTLFAAATKDGKVHVFDLMMNRQHPTCSYSVYGPKKHINLTTVSFNPKMPIIVVGDEKGCILSFKLSPNLRSSLKGLHELEKTKFIESEIDKMEKVLKVAKGPEARDKKQ